MFRTRADSSERWCLLRCDDLKTWNLLGVCTISTQIGGDDYYDNGGDDGYGDDGDNSKNTPQIDNDHQENVCQRADMRRGRGWQGWLSRR